MTMTPGVSPLDALPEGRALFRSLADIADPVAGVICERRIDGVPWTAIAAELGIGVADAQQRAAALSAVITDSLRGLDGI